MGPVLYSVTASDLESRTPGNEMRKFADDTYLIVPASNWDTCEKELGSIEAWSDANNLKLNRNKTLEIIFTKKRTPQLVLPPELPHIQRVDKIKILGVTINNKLSVRDHIESVVASCSQSMHALRILRSHGMHDSLIHKIFNSIILSKLSYASPAWRGFMLSCDITRIDSVINRAKKFGYCASNVPNVTEIFDSADSKLFEAVSTNQFHVLFPLLPRKKTTFGHNLRRHTHDFILSAKRSKIATCNFLTRMLYHNIF